MSGNFTDLLIQLNTVATDDSVPPWAKVLIECFQRFMSLYDNFHPQNLNNTINELNDEIANLRADVKQLKELNDDYEQRNRNECLVVHGIPETQGIEDTDKLVSDNLSEKLEIDLTPNLIKRSHRLGPRKTKEAGRTRSQTSNATQSPRPIIFRLHSYRNRHEIFTKKKKLKGSGITITENLTRTRLKLYKDASEKFGRGNVWTLEGRITVKIGNIKHMVTTNDDLRTLVINNPDLDTNPDPEEL